MGACVSKEKSPPSSTPPSSNPPPKGKDPEPASPSGASPSPSPNPPPATVTPTPAPTPAPAKPSPSPAPANPTPAPAKPSPANPTPVPAPSPNPHEEPELTEAEREEKLKKIFLQVDKDNSGFIDINELKVLLERMKLTMDDENVKFILNRYDDDHNEKLNFEEFCEMILSMMEVKKAFQLADKDKNGNVTAAEMHDVLGTKQLSTDVIKEIIVLFDQNNNGTIEYREFIALYFYVNELEYQHKMFQERKGQDFNWLMPLLGPDNASKANEVGKQLIEWKKQKPYPPLSDFAKIIVTAAEGPTTPMGRAKVHAPLILSQRARVRPPPRKVMPIKKHEVEAFKHDGGPYIDPAFVPSNELLPPRMQGMVKEWKRMKDINIDAKLFVNGVEEGDVIQGGLGDCWFLGALAVVATSAENFIEHLFVQQIPEIGYYQCKFYKNGKWELVEVDDKLPVNERGNLVFASCRDPSEFWVPIVEKAYAKLHGSYASLESGSISDGLKDLTGEGIEVTQLDTKEFQNDHDATWKHLLHNAGESFLMGCAIDVADGKTEHQLDCGLLSGHAYSIISCQNVHGNQLIRMRNPWGRGEWNGAWSDNSKEWNPALLKELNYQFANDGTFFIAFSDFIQYYHKVYVLRLLTDSVGEIWNKYSNRGAWKGESAAGCANHHNWLDNPQYALKVPSAGTKIFINLSQPDLRYILKKSLAAVDKDYDAIGLYILKAKDLAYRKTEAGQDEKIAVSNFTNVRDLSFECTLPTGNYVVVPCTFNAGVQLPYDLEFYANKPIELSPLTAIMPSIAVNSEWRGATAGGCANNRDTWMHNPQFLLVCSSAGTVDIHLTQEDIPKKELEAVGIYVFGAPIKARVDKTELLLAKPKNIINLPTVTESLTVAPNAIYVIMPTTFEQGLERKFSISVSSVNATIAEFRAL